MRLPSLLILVSCVASSSCASPSEEEVVASDEAAATMSTQPVKLVDLNGAGVMCLSSSHIYFWDSALHAIRRVTKTGNGAVTTIADLPDANVVRCLTDSTHVWAVVARGGQGQDKGQTVGEIVRIPLAGGAIESRISGEGIDAAHFAIDSTHAYFAAAGKLARFPKTGAFVEAESLGVASNVTDLVLDGTYVIWSDAGPPNATGGCTENVGKILRRSKTGGATAAVTTLASGEDCPTAVTIDAGTIYFRSGLGPIRKVGSLSASTFTSAKTTFGPIADSTYIGYAETSAVASEGMQLVLVSKLWGNVYTFTKTRTGPHETMTALESDATYAFYMTVNAASGYARIHRVAK